MQPTNKFDIGDNVVWLKSLGNHLRIMTIVGVRFEYTAGFGPEYIYEYQYSHDSRGSGEIFSAYGSYYEFHAVKSINPNKVWKELNEV